MHCIHHIVYVSYHLLRDDIASNHLSGDAKDISYMVSSLERISIVCITSCLAPAAYFIASAEDQSTLGCISLCHRLSFYQICMMGSYEHVVFTAFWYRCHLLVLGRMMWSRQSTEWEAAMVSVPIFNSSVCTDSLSNIESWTNFDCLFYEVSHFAYSILCERYQMMIRYKTRCSFSAL